MNWLRKLKFLWLGPINCQYGKSLKREIAKKVLQNKTKQNENKNYDFFSRDIFMDQ